MSAITEDRHEPGVPRTANAIAAALAPGRKGVFLEELLAAQAGDDQFAVMERWHLRATADSTRTDADRTEVAALRAGNRSGVRDLDQVLAALAHNR
ncbi:hypothetical protein [Streptomyces roseus]|uniref:Uncharacterized protein n=1 Tax=Streptomyces roseus TaxID=66430 RepID=A0A0J6XIW3_9ACTN|nr:hypothetical protein [Streptomyces roseus]KMO94578.1 hypothetical protein ACS04_28670 [Streptomyces roseus]MYT20204.1 hypothetical protein [Streptomyces sp. SID7760]